MAGVHHEVVFCTRLNENDATSGLVQVGLSLDRPYTSSQSEIVTPAEWKVF